MQFGLLTPVLSLSPGKHAAWEMDGTIDDVARIAEAADGLGYDYMTCSEHVAIPVDHEGGFGGGQRPGARYWDPLPTFAYLAARTRRIRFTTLVLVLSYHHPLDVAKRYGSLDRICHGRLNLGVGVGYLKPEFELLGIPFEDRNARSDDALQAIRASFGRSIPEYEGPYFTILRHGRRSVRAPTGHPHLGRGANAPITPACRRIGRRLVPVRSLR